MEGNQALCIFCCKKVNRGSNPDYEEPDHEEILERFLFFTDRHFNCIDKKFSSISNTKALSKSSNACLKCFGIIEYYCNLYHQIECLKLQLNCQLKKVWKVMSYADRVPARVKAFREWCHGNVLISSMNTEVHEDDPGSGGPIKFRQAFKRRCKLFLGRTSPRLLITPYSSKTNIMNEHDHEPLPINDEKHLPVNLNSNIGKQIKNEKRISEKDKRYFLGWISSFATVIFLYHWSPESPGSPPAILEIDESPSPPRSTSLPIIIRVINRRSSGFSGNTQSKSEIIKQKLNTSLNMYSEESNSQSYSDGYEDDYTEPVAKQRRTKLEEGTGIRSGSNNVSRRCGGGGNRASHYYRPSSSSGSYLNGSDQVNSHHRPQPPFNLEPVTNPESESSIRDTFNSSPGSNSADVRDQGEGGTVMSASDLEEFSRYFKRRRTKFGYSQADVGISMSSIYGDVFSQTTISRFEALQLSYKNLLKLQPVMQKWLEEVETGITPTVDKDAAPLFKKRKKRTNIPPNIKASLENYFRQDSKPSTEEIIALANNLQLEKEVVRVWFCNRRQKENTSDNFDSRVTCVTDTGEEQGYADDSRDPLNDFVDEEKQQDETGSNIRFVVKKESIDYSEDEAAIMVQESPLVRLQNGAQTSTYIPNRGYQFQ